MKTKRLVLAMSFVAMSVFAVTSAGAASRSPVSIHVNLDATIVTAGHPIHGTAILTNASSKSILVEACASDGWLFVGLANKSVPYDPAVATVACSATIKLKPGANRFPIVVLTVYDVCYQSGGTPRCGKLPKGTYHVAVETIGLPKGTFFSAHIRVTLT